MQNVTTTAAVMYPTLRLVIMLMEHVHANQDGKDLTVKKISMNVYLIYFHAETTPIVSILMDTTFVNVILVSLIRMIQKEFVKVSKAS